MYESGVARLWEVERFNLGARCSFLLPCNLMKTCMSVNECVCIVSVCIYRSTLSIVHK